MKRPPMNTETTSWKYKTNPMNKNSTEKFKPGNFDYKKRVKSKEFLDGLR
jgi:hypothetical protein